MANIPDDFRIDGLVVGDALKKAASTRSKKIIKKQVAESRLGEETEKGWILQKRLKSGACNLIKEKEGWRLFEDQVWSLFYNMGFEELNGNTKDLEINRVGNGKKQIDVFARDEQTICIIECKYTEKPHTSSTSLPQVRNAINDIASLQREELPAYIFKHYRNTTGDTHKTYKLVWILALKNIDISDHDRNLADSHNITILDDATISYYEQLSKQFSHASKYMFLGQYLCSKRIPGNPVTIPAIRGTMGGYNYYSFSATPESLLKISYLAHKGNTNLPPLETYQRIAKKKRLDKIAEYIVSSEENGKGAIFPTSIVVNFSTDIKFQEIAGQKGEKSKIGRLTLPNEYNSAWIIDGQHRLYAYSKLDKEAKTALLPIIAFEKLPANEQAQLFVDINGKQEKVESTLLNEIKANTLLESPRAKDRLEAIYSQIALLLNKESSSVLYDRVVEANLGKGDSTKNITNTTLTDELYKSQLVGTPNSKNPKNMDPGLLYQGSLEESRDFITSILSDYYRIFLENDVLRDQWNLGKGEGGFLCTNHGIRSTIKLFSLIILHIHGDIIKGGDYVGIKALNKTGILDRVRPYLKPVIEYLASASDTDLKLIRQKSSGSGVASTTDRFITIINDEFPEFYPDKAEQYRQKHAQENRSRNNLGRDIGDRIEEAIRSFVVQELKENFGLDVGEWWAEGVPQKVSKKIEDEAHKLKDYSHEYEKYLMFGELHEIITKKSDLFGSKFVLYAKESASKKVKFEWIKRCADLKDKYSLEDGEIITPEDLDFLNDAWEKLSSKLDE